MVKLLICVGLAFLLHVQLGSSYKLSQPNQPDQPQLPPHIQPIQLKPMIKPSGDGGPSLYCRCLPDGFYADLSDKGHYYQCYQGRTYQQSCAGGLVFDTSCNCCNWA